MVLRDFYVFVVQRQQKGKKKLITGISGIVFWSKNGCLVTVNWFSESGLLKHLFL